VAGNIERLEILLGHAERAIAAIRKRLEAMQAQGAKYDEIVSRSNLAWGLRILGRSRDALHELDVALGLARETGTFNVMLEFLHYDRSVVLGALGDIAGARAAYRRYLRSSASTRAAPPSSGPAAEAARRPLEPFFLKRADRFIAEHIAQDLALAALAAHCGVSCRTLQGAFAKFRGITAVAHIRNVRLDHAHRALAEDAATVKEVAARCGFRSTTTFALEYRKRFGMPPSRRKRGARQATA
jgi:AraC-like DNA-binding protein